MMPSNDKKSNHLKIQSFQRIFFHENECFIFDMIDYIQIQNSLSFLQPWLWADFLNSFLVYLWLCLLRSNFFWQKYLFLLLLNFQNSSVLLTLLPSLAERKKNFCYRKVLILIFAGNMFTSTNTFGAAATQPNPNKDMEVPSPPDDTVTCLRFSPAQLPQSTYLIATSWDNHVRCWEVTSNSIAPKAQQSHGGPVLDAAWSHDGTKVFTCSVDKTAYMWDLQSNSFTQVNVWGCLKIYQLMLHE